MNGKSICSSLVSSQICSMQHDIETTDDADVMDTMHSHEDNEGM